jgi:lipoate-protein ligase A
MYALVLSYQLRPELRDITRAHNFVLDQIVNAVQPLIGGQDLASCAGTSDLAIARNIDEVISHSYQNVPSTTWRKFSGNSLRVKRLHCLYHGTLLYDFDLSLIPSCLCRPPRQPEYRDARPHLEFVTNLSVGRDKLIDALDEAWPTEAVLREVPLSRVVSLVAERFGRDSWNFEFA